MASKKVESSYMEVLFGWPRSRLFDAAAKRLKRPSDLQKEIMLDPSCSEDAIPPGAKKKLGRTIDTK